MRIVYLALTLAIGAGSLAGVTTPASAAGTPRAMVNKTLISVAEAVQLHQGSGKATVAGEFSCYAVYFRSRANGRYVSAELGWGGDQYGMLRARATSIGPWEQFGLCFGTSYDVIYSLANGQYISAELGWGGDQYGMLRARATSIGPWEQFHFYCPLIDGSCVLYSFANGLHTSTELGWGGDRYAMLRARATSIGPWEKFD